MTVVKIDCGIGEISASTDGNLKLNMLLEAIKEKIERGGLDDLVKYLS